MNIFSAFFARFSPFAGPASAGTNGQVLATDGAGATSWVDATAATTDASLLTSGTLPDARLSSNIPTKSYTDNGDADTLAAAQTYADNGDAGLAVAIGGKLAKVSNLSDLTNVPTARGNLGLGTAAVASAGDFEAAGAVSAHAAIVSGVHGISAFGATLVDDTNAAAARSTLGLGTAALSSTSDFEAAGGIATHSALVSGVHGISAFGATLTDDANAAAARTTLGLGTAATSNTTAFEAAGGIATHAALTSGVHGITSFGSTLVDDADAAAARSTLGLGTAATSNTGAFEAAGAVSTHSALVSGVHGISAFGATLTDDADAATARATLAAAGTGVANTFTAQQTFEVGASGASPVIVQQTGGTNTKRIELSHDGTDGLIYGKAGELRLKSTANLRLFSANGNSILFRNSSDNATLFGVDGSGIITAKAFLITTPSQITSNQNDYNPGQSNYYRLSSDASRDITGWLVSQVAGQAVFSIVNVGSQNIVLKHQSASSTAANRFICKGAADITLAADEEAAMWYDGTTLRWRIHKV